MIRAFKGWPGIGKMETCMQDRRLERYGMRKSGKNDPSKQGPSGTLRGVIRLCRHKARHEARKLHHCSHGSYNPVLLSA